MKVSVVMLAVSQLEASLAFYRDTLQMKVQHAGGDFAFLDGGGVTISLRATKDLKPMGDDRRVELVLGVEDIDAAYARLKGLGVAFRLEPRVVTGDQLAADFRDPDGHVLSIFGPRGPKR
jgi:catechol 2,3-dioxygenase-like lactoylglutathione lyase family enzyme